MRRHFYISNNLDELENVEKELESHGISTPHIHVLSLNDGATPVLELLPGVARGLVAASICRGAGVIVLRANS